MSTDRDTTRIVRSWMDEGLTTLPDRVLDAVLDQIPTTPQRRVFWLARRFPPLNNTRLVIAAGVIVVAAVAYGTSFIGRGIGGPPNPSSLPVATPGELPTAAFLEPGSYFVVNRSRSVGPDYRSITFTVPDGWAVTDGLIFKHLGQPNEVALSVWEPGVVYRDPCHWKGSGISATDPSYGDLAVSTLHNQAGREGSTPTAVTFGGVQGDSERIELSVPGDLDITTCDEGEYRSWTAYDVPNRANSHHAPGQIDVVYFVNVDRRPLLVDASHRPAASPQDLAELQAVLDSMFIDNRF